MSITIGLFTEILYFSLIKRFDTYFSRKISTNMWQSESCVFINVKIYTINILYKKNLIIFHSILKFTSIFRLFLNLVCIVEI